MSVKKTQTALIKHLKLLLPQVPTAYEAVSFDSPLGLYQRVQFRILSPDDPVVGKGYYRERVEMQIFVYAPTNSGTGLVLNRAELLQNHFGKGLTLVESDLKVHVLRTPQVSGTAVIGSKIVCPVLISTITEVEDF
ncbi:MAG: phage tail terminator-like protein [Waterburya sp.]